MFATYKMCYPRVDNRSTLLSQLCTCKHHDVLKVGSNLVPAAQVEQKGQRVDVCCPAKKHCHLRNTGRSRTKHSRNNTSVGKVKGKITVGRRQYGNSISQLTNLSVCSVILWLPESVNKICFQESKGKKKENRVT